jgi:hypothetical protein
MRVETGANVQWRSFFISAPPLQHAFERISLLSGFGLNYGVFFRYLGFLLDYHACQLTVQTFGLKLRPFLGYLGYQLDFYLPACCADSWPELRLFLGYLGYQLDYNV